MGSFWWKKIDKFRLKTAILYSNKFGYTIVCEVGFNALPTTTSYGEVVIWLGKDDLYKATTYSRAQLFKASLA